MLATMASNSPWSGFTASRTGGAGVSPGGYRGPAGDRAYSATTAAFTTPAANASVAILVDAAGWMSAGQPLYIGGAGMYQVVSVTNATSVVVYNLGYENNTAAGAVISSGALVSAGGFSGPQGPQGPQGPTGGTGPAGPAGGNAYTNTTAAFTVPAANTTVEVLVLTTTWMSADQPVFIQGAGMYQVVSITNTTSAVVYNLGYANNTAAGAVISSGVLVSAGGFSGPQGAQGPTGSTGSTGPAGPAGGNAYTNTTAAFTVPLLSPPGDLVEFDPADAVGVSVAAGGLDAL